ncbi:MAG: transcriptional repressor [Spirochaetes bacterium]|nr:transcriptional repressor [Spirochaetota bacterium]
METYNRIFNEYLKKINKEYSKQIKFITDTVFDIHAHFTIKDLKEKIKDEKIKDKIVSETLNNLIASGLIRKIYFQDKQYYEQIYGHAHHDHLICTKCSKIVPFRDEIIEKEQERIVAEKGFELLKHSLLIVGICPECLGKKELIEEYEFQKEDKGLDKERILPLSMIPAGEKVKVVEFHGGKHFSHRLISMGLNIGDSVEVISNNFQGPFLLKIKNTRLGLGHGMTHRILVKK